ncbi:5'-methylthioadenosine/S-adenosylhomocysteine nucleosidase family protein [Aspergillus undulatus]|uniref:5'-methylthioadenosine/S-adenosylhomocysteine nucleosidase family protein n=1 Tax=Aspergillus undulatus TaxID=1810928 RepID=UPI003CCD4392
MDTGVEISLEILAALIQTRKTSFFDGKIYLKGYAIILVPTELTGNTVIWHAIYNEDDSYIAYVDPRIEKLPGLYPGNIQFEQMKDYRHIVGWCSSVINNTGSTAAAYNIRRPGLLRPSGGSYFRNVFVHSGMRIGEATKIVFGRQNQPRYRGFDNYTRKLMWICRKSLVFFDTRDKRGWLVDGASALLHLVRASLVAEAEEFPNIAGLDWTKSRIYQYSAGESAKKASLVFLQDMDNQALGLYCGANLPPRAPPSIHGNEANTEAPATLRDRVEEIVFVMEQVIAHQEQLGIERESGIRTKGASHILEGFNFMDLATVEDKFSARCIEIPPECNGWIEFAKSIFAPVLFGTGFGELIQPRRPDVTCPRWRHVPPQSYHLTACVSDITAIIEKQGSFESSPWRAAAHTIWHSPGKTFEPCLCNDETGAMGCDRVQVMLPDTCLEAGSNKYRSPKQLAEDGAIIFGQSASFHSMNDEPATANTGRNMQSYNSPFTDSGIGESESSRDPSDLAEGPRASSKRPHSPESAKKAGKRHQIEGFSPGEPGILAGQHRQHFQDSEAMSSSPTSDHSNPFRNSPADSRPVLLPSSTPPNHEFKVGWLCAIKVELDCALKMLDRTYTRGRGHGSDSNFYTLGQIGGHNVVITCLPRARYGNSAAVAAATRMMNKFPNIEIGLMVGIGGGIPTEGNDVRLGDVVVSKPEGQHGGVLQYDMGKITTNGFETIGYLHPPPEILLSALNYVPANGPFLTPDMGDLYGDYRPELRALYPGEDLDILLESDKPAPRPLGHRATSGPHIFYGTIASGNAVIKDSSVREQLREKHNCLCFEMEAAGLLSTSFPCLVIRGIADYADSQKNDAWHEYAALSAATFAKTVLLAIPDILDEDP